MRKEQLRSLTIDQERYNNHTISGRNGESMQAQPPVGHQTNFFGTDLLLQLDAQDPLLKLSTVIPWSDFDQAFKRAPIRPAFVSLRHIIASSMLTQ